MFDVLDMHGMNNAYSWTRHKSIRDGGGQISGVLVCVNDVGATAKKLDELAHRQSELRKAVTRSRLGCRWCQQQDFTHKQALQRGEQSRDVAADAPLTR